MKTENGFILIESLVSLAMVSVLAVSTLNLLHTVSVTFKTNQGDELSRVSLEATLNTDSISNRPDMRLETIHSLSDDSTWRIYSYRSEDGSREQVPIYVPANN